MHLPLAAEPERKPAIGINVVDYKRETSESILWETGGAKMGTQAVSGTLSGLGAGDSFVAYKFEKRYDILEAYIGYLKTAAKGRSCHFEVIADGVTIFTSELMTSATEPTKVRIPIKGHDLVVLMIRPENYGATAGAAWGSPMVYIGVPPEDMPKPVTVEINGKSSKLNHPGGGMPKELLVPIPVTPGNSEYRVKVVSDPILNKVKIQVEKVTP